MSIGRRERVSFPESYADFRLIRIHGQVYAIPPTVDPEKRKDVKQLFSHPSAFSANSLEEIKTVIDGLDRNALKPQLVESRSNCEIVSFRGAFHAVPWSAEPFDFAVKAERQRAGVVSRDSLAELDIALGELARAQPVEFAGWLPIYEFSGNCGTHPQFTHTDRPPDGYRFVRSGPSPTVSQSQKPTLLGRLITKVTSAIQTVNSIARVPLAFFKPLKGVTLRGRWRVFVALMKFATMLLRKGCKLSAIVKFLQSRHLQSQLLLGDPREVVFLTSMPYTFGQNPWVIEVEDPTTLFYPLIQNGNTGNIALRESPYQPIVKALLEAEPCRAILTHMRSSAEMISVLFQSEIIDKKLIHAPLGVNLPAIWQRHDSQSDDEPIDLLFINSWCQVPENFFVRGGLDVLEAFSILRIRYPQLRLTMRTSLPALAEHYHKIMEDGWVRLVNRFMPAEELAELHAQSHIFLLPAARVHIVSLLQAMSYGLAVVASDGWGFEEYLTHEHNGLIVRGRYGKASWADYEEGMLRENYDFTHTPDPEVVAGIVEAVSRLVEDRALRRRLGRTAREDVRTLFNMASWNDGLRRALDRAKSTDDAPTPEVTTDSRKSHTSLTSQSA